ncbi:MAG: DUF512 domain-containing protein [bacterium]|jgi:putative radical SAM enzyme (TIGR03279 family)
MKIIYCCYGSAHSSVIAAAIHLNRLPWHRVPTAQEILQQPHFDQTKNEEIGTLFFIGVDQWGNEVFILGLGADRVINHRAIDSLLSLCNYPSCEVRLIDSLIAIHPLTRIGGFFSRRLGLVSIGRPIVLLGIRLSYPCLLNLVQKHQLEIVNSLTEAKAERIAGSLTLCLSYRIIGKESWERKKNMGKQSDFQGITISQVREDSIAADLGISIGDQLLTINEVQPKDLIDYRFLIAGEMVHLHIRKKNGQHFIYEIEKEYDEDLGLGFTDASFPGIKKCANKCIFCFVDQMPPGMRPSLYVKDDDYRLSFLEGNFITLTNLSELDFERILKMRLSPLYVSVHTVNPRLRQKIMGNNRAGEIKKQLQRLAEGGIGFHAQVVLVPGINDGSYLEETVHTLVDFWPHALSLAIVPVGLTGHRDNLAQLRSFSTQEAKKLILWARDLQRRLRQKLGATFLYLADEFYVLAAEEVPQREDYDGFPQLENGVGLLRLFFDELAELALPLKLREPCKITLCTGVLATGAVQRLAQKLQKVEGLKVQVERIINHFFGETVTVAGLVTGSDLLRQLKGKELGDCLFLPEVMLRNRTEEFLDNLTVSQLSTALGVPVEIVSGPVAVGEWFLRRDGKKNV